MSVVFGRSCAGVGNKQSRSVSSYSNTLRNAALLVTGMSKDKNRNPFVEGLKHELVFETRNDRCMISSEASKMPLHAELAQAVVSGEIPMSLFYNHLFSIEDTAFVKAYYSNWYGLAAYLPDFAAKPNKPWSAAAGRLQCTYPFVQRKYSTPTLCTISVYIYTVYSVVLPSYTSIYSF